MNQSEKRVFLIKRLLKEQPEYANMHIPTGTDDQKYLLRSLMNIRMPDEIDEEFLNKQVLLALDFCNLTRKYSTEEKQKESYDICKNFFSKIPMIRDYIESDLQAAFDGDPAAGCKEEIILAYPGLMASSINRLAHELYLLKVPVLPRIMTEYAYSETGIDIHPGATIGKYFVIDN